MKASVSLIIDNNMSAIQILLRGVISTYGYWEDAKVEVRRRNGSRASRKFHTAYLEDDGKLCHSTSQKAKVIPDMDH